MTTVPIWPKPRTPDPRYYRTGDSIRVQYLDRTDVANPRAVAVVGTVLGTPVADAYVLSSGTGAHATTVRIIVEDVLSVDLAS